MPYHTGFLNVDPRRFPIRIHQIHRIPGAISIRADEVVLLAQRVHGRPASIGGGVHAGAKVVEVQADECEAFLAAELEGLPVGALSLGVSHRRIERLVIVEVASAVADRSGLAGTVRRNRCGRRHGCKFLAIRAVGIGREDVSVGIGHGAHAAQVVFRVPAVPGRAAAEIHIAAIKQQHAKVLLFCYYFFCGLIKNFSVIRVKIRLNVLHELYDKTKVSVFLLREVDGDNGKVIGKGH